ncbi:hypothetical protein ACWEQL_19610 [Kitasatospora sp. NPDC004240]
MNNAVALREECDPGGRRLLASGAASAGGRAEEVGGAGAAEGSRGDGDGHGAHLLLLSWGIDTMTYAMVVPSIRTLPTLANANGGANRFIRDPLIPPRACANTGHREHPARQRC